MAHPDLRISPRKIFDRVLWIALFAAIGGFGFQGWEWYRAVSDQANVVRLNRMVAQYRQRTGRTPDLNMIELFRAGLSDKRLHRTPYGGTYQIDPERMIVYNPHRRDR